MKANCCCSAGAPRSAGAPWRRIGQAAGWIVPSLVLAALPKCPVCAAAYITLFTGFGITLAAAGALRYLLMAACIGCLGYLILKTVR